MIAGEMENTKILSAIRQLREAIPKAETIWQATMVQRELPRWFTSVLDMETDLMAMREEVEGLVVDEKRLRVTLLAIQW